MLYQWLVVLLRLVLCLFSQQMSPFIGERAALWMASGRMHLFILYIVGMHVCPSRRWIRTRDSAPTNFNLQESIKSLLCSRGHCLSVNSCLAYVYQSLLFDHTNLYAISLHSSFCLQESLCQCMRTYMSRLLKFSTLLIHFF